jgi:hypothetical protein
MVIKNEPNQEENSAIGFGFGFDSDSSGGRCLCLHFNVWSHQDALASYSFAT